MPTSSDDLSKYLPDAATADAVTDEAVRFEKELSRPDLVEKLARMKTSPDLTEATQASAGVYVAPTTVSEETPPTLPQARVKVGPRSKAAEAATLPGLRKRSPRVLGVAVRRSSPGAMMLAVLAVMVPVVVVIVLFVKPEKPPRVEGGGMSRAATSAMVVGVGEEAGSTSAAPVVTAAPTVSAGAAAPTVSAATPSRPQPPGSRKKKPANAADASTGSDQDPGLNE